MLYIQLIFFIKNSIFQCFIILKFQEKINNNKNEFERADNKNNFDENRNSNMEKNIENQQAEKPLDKPDLKDPKCINQFCIKL